MQYLISLSLFLFWMLAMLCLVVTLISALNASLQAKVAGFWFCFVLFLFKWWIGNFQMSISSKILSWNSPFKHSLQNLSILPALTCSSVPWLASVPPQQDGHAGADSLPAAIAATCLLETALGLSEGITGPCGPHSAHSALAHGKYFSLWKEGRKSWSQPIVQDCTWLGMRDVASNSLFLWWTARTSEKEISIPWNTFDLP